MYLGVFELAKQTTHLRRETIIEIFNEVEYSVGWGVAIQCQGYNNCILLAVNRSIQYWKKYQRTGLLRRLIFPFFQMNRRTYLGLLGWPSSSLMRNRKGKPLGLDYVRFIETFGS